MTPGLQPWFKARHHKRRVVNQELSTTLAAELAPHGGALLFKTDVEEVFDSAMEVLCFGSA